VIPTAEQLYSCFVLTCWATKMYLPVFLVTIDERTGDVFFLAGEETEVLIERNGLWGYL
jgi:hypothetical protein